MINSDEGEIKVILVGETGTGKTSLINVAMGLKFTEGVEASTSAASFVTKKIKIGDKEYILNLWDTIGQERFRSLTKIFIKDSKIVIFVYDITRLQTFNELDFWFKTIHDVLGDEPILGIVGNKKDLIMKEQVNEEKAEKYADDKNVPLKLTTAKNPLSFNIFLEDLLKKYIEKKGGIIETSDGKKLENKKGNNNKKEKKFC